MTQRWRKADPKTTSFLKIQRYSSICLPSFVWFFCVRPAWAVGRYRLTKVLRDTYFVDSKMRFAPKARQAYTLYTRHNSHFDVNIVCVPEYFCHPV